MTGHIHSSLMYHCQVIGTATLNATENVNIIVKILSTVIESKKKYARACWYKLMKRLILKADDSRNLLLSC